MYSGFQLIETYCGFRIRSHETKHEKIICVTCGEGDARTFVGLLALVREEFDKLRTSKEISAQNVIDVPCKVDQEMVVAATGQGYIFERYAINAFKRAIDNLWRQNLSNHK